ncbi:MAG: hypothetical protein U0835_13665 [Isosphaeraceae bacterium]
MNDATAKPHTWVWSVLLGLILFGAYMANGREVGSEDSESTSLQVIALLRGEGLRLDRFYVPLLRNPRFMLPIYVVPSRGHYRSLYPPGTTLLAAPIAALPLFARDLTEPGWDRNFLESYQEAKRVSKFAAAVIAALIGVALDRTLRLLGLGRHGPVVVLTAGLASTLWPVASQALWQHGPAALMLTLTVALLLPRNLPRWRLVLAGITAGMLVACRMIDVVFAAAALGYVAREKPRGLVWFLPGPIIIGSALLAYNFYYFDTVVGGQARLESLHPALHGVDGPWSGNVVGGALGTLFSPSRGLFVHSPWVLIVLMLVPAYARSMRPWPLLYWMLGAVAADLLVLSKYAVWWAGHSFGPRYWTDAVPIFAILLAFSFDWCRTHSRALRLAFALAVAWSVAVQSVGAFLFPSGWNLTPADVDTHHERLWHWLDNEVTRCLYQSRFWRGS